MPASGANANAITIKSRGSPARNIWKPKVRTTRAVMPTSGCRIKMVTIIPTTAEAHAHPGNASCSRHRPSNQAVIITNIGLINSDGCRRSPPSINHLVAPFTSGPMTSVATINPVIASPPSKHKMRMVLPLRIEVISITNKAGSMKNICRKTK